MIIPVEKGVEIDTSTNEVLMTADFIRPMVIDSLKAEGKEVSESNIYKVKLALLAEMSKLLKETS